MDLDGVLVDVGCAEEIAGLVEIVAAPRLAQHAEMTGVAVAGTADLPDRQLAGLAR